ncbi:MAG: HNH endonuclease [Caldilineae bacterium]|nr:MAG: HNH endonuclease [Caldilineae bacterium]
MNGAVLVLNASYEPLNIVSIKRAVVLLLKEKAELVEAAEQRLRSEHLELPRPLVIRLVHYVKVPRRLGIPLTRRMILARDNDTCQYCGAQPGKAELTIDHVLPRSRGGQKVWENVVTACRSCNQRKGNRTPKEAHMKLIRQPYRPRYVALAIVGEMQQNSVWRKYIGEA